MVATPTFVVNGEIISGFSYEQLQRQIDAQDNAGRKQDSEKAVGMDSANLSYGPKDAPLRIEWYADLTSPLTPESAVALENFVTRHSGEVKVEFKNFPLRTHPFAMIVHEFAVAAAAQGKFWEVEALLLADAKPIDRAQLKNIARQAQLDQKLLWSDLDSHLYAAFIERDLAQAKQRGVTGTPTFVVDGRKLDGVNALSVLP